MQVQNISSFPLHLPEQQTTEELSQSVILGSNTQKCFEGNYSNMMDQPHQDQKQSPQKEQSKKITENKQKYKKLKTKLNHLCEVVMQNHKEPKDISSPNKSRILKLMMQFEKIVKSQTKDYHEDYQTIENILKDLMRIVDHKRDHDLIIMRQSKFISTVSILLKKYPTFHKNEAVASTQSVEYCLKLLKIFLTLKVNRQYFLFSNTLSVIHPLLSCLIQKQRLFSMNCLCIINSILSTIFTNDLQQILQINIEIILSLQLFKKIKSKIENLLEEEYHDVELMFLLSKFQYLLIYRYCYCEFERATYEQPLYGNSINKHLVPHLEGILQNCHRLLIQTIYEKQESEDSYDLRDPELSNTTLNLLLYISRLINILSHISMFQTQASLQLSTPFLNSLKFIMQYCKIYFKESHQCKSLCSQIMILMCNICLDNRQNQETVRKVGLLEEYCNHPVQYLMEPHVHVYVTGLCCIIHKNQANIKCAFSQNSSYAIQKYIKKQQQKNEKQQQEIDLPQKPQLLSRKASTHSLNSNYSKQSIAESLTTQASSINNSKQYISNSYRFFVDVKLEHKFRTQFWDDFLEVLKNVDQ